MINFKLVSDTKRNSKGITHRIISDTGAQLCVGREADCIRVLEETVKLQKDGAQFAYKPEYKMYTVQALVPFNLLGNVYYREITLGYSPDGYDLDGLGNSVFVNVSGACLTAAYIAPEALPIVDENGILSTNLGQFRLTVKNSERVSVEKI